MSIKPGKATRIKRQLYEAFSKPTVKAQSIATFLLTNPGAVQPQHKGKYWQTALHREGCFNYRRLFWSCLIIIDSGLDITGEEICWPEGCPCDAQLSSPFWLGWKVLVDKLPHHNNLSFIEEDRQCKKEMVSVDWSIAVEEQLEENQQVNQSTPISNKEPSTSKL